MNAPNPWSKFFWNDWENDPALRLCSLSAQGLWMRILCICAKSDPVGYLTVEGHPLNHDDLALLIGRPAAELVPLLTELADRGVHSRDGKGRIYSRRLVRDARASAEAKKTGKLGGNPSLLNQKEKTEGDNPPDKGEDNTQSPESRVHKPEKRPPEGPPVASRAKKPKAAVSALTPDWSLPDAWREIATNRGWSNAAADNQAMKFKQYFFFGKGAGKKRSDIGWQQSWINWLERELKSHPDAATFGKDDETPSSKPTSESRLPEDVRAKLKTQYAFNDSVIQRWFEPCLIDLDKGFVAAPTAFHASYLENNYSHAINLALGREMKIIVRKFGTRGEQ